MKLTAKEIQEIIPHRYPFLLIDTIEEMEPGKWGKAKKNVTINEPFFQGHFPGEPVMPGVLIMEALAQTGAVVLLIQEEYRGKIAYFGGMDKVRFRRPVLPGDTLTLQVEVTKWKGGIGTAKGVALVGEQKAAEAELMVAVR